ncbi:MAG: hypothetical protein IAF58_09695 [Leptolyngbya sp.]|nr:hypothetical protein [Candidatus Melainabacteria bacterium]
MKNHHATVVGLEVALACILLLLSADFVHAQQLSQIDKIRLGKAIISTYPKDTAVIEVNLNKHKYVNSMVGFVHAMDAHRPLSSKIEPLKPKIWRSGTLTSQIYKRTKSFNARQILVLSDLWGYPGKDSKGERWNPPYQNYSEWEKFVEKIAIRAKNQPVIFEIWNEPDGSNFWRGTKSQLLETNVRASKVLEKILGSNVEIAGPSLERYNYNAIIEYVDYFKRAGARLTCLTWHEFRSDILLPKMSEDICRIGEAVIKPNEKIGLKEIIIGEYDSEQSQFRPGSLLAYLYYFEKGGCSGAAKACWNEPDGVNNCWNCSLDGLLNAQGETRIVWWLYKLYSESIVDRVDAESNDPRVIAFASHNYQTQILVGYCGAKEICPQSKKITVKINGLRVKPGESVSFNVKLLERDNLKACRELSTVYTGKTNWQGEVCILELPALRLFDAFAISLASSSKQKN